MDPKQIGAIDFKVDGEVFSFQGALTLNAGDPYYEPQIGGDGQVFKKVVFQAPMVKGSLFHVGTADLSRLAQAQNVTCTCRLRNGSVFVISRASWGATGELNTENGTIEGGWIGEDGTWLVENS